MKSDFSAILFPNDGSIFYLSRKYAKQAGAHPSQFCDWRVDRRHICTPGNLGIFHIAAFDFYRCEGWFGYGCCHPDSRPNGVAKYTRGRTRLAGHLESDASKIRNQFEWNTSGEYRSNDKHQYKCRQRPNTCGRWHSSSSVRREYTKLSQLLIPIFILQSPSRLCYIVGNYGEARGVGRPKTDR